MSSFPEAGHKQGLGLNGEAAKVMLGLPPRCCQADSANRQTKVGQRLAGGTRVLTERVILLRTHMVSLPLALHALLDSILPQHP